MSRNTAFRRTEQDSFADALASAASPEIMSSEKDAFRDQRSATRRWNQAAFEKALKNLPHKAKLNSADASATRFRDSNENAATESALSYARALRLHSRVDSGLGDLPQTGVSNSRPKSKKLQSSSQTVQRSLKSAVRPQRKETHATEAPSSMEVTKRILQSAKIELKERRAMAQAELPQQRRTAVSLRLTDTELEQLRQRAAESGTNVSAYVRSCVIEAEVLRSQVRQVMAEMRALGAASLVQRPVLAPAAKAENNKKESRTLTFWKSASCFLLQPLYFLRHLHNA